MAINIVKLHTPCKKLYFPRLGFVNFVTRAEAEKILGMSLDKRSNQFEQNYYENFIKMIDLKNLIKKIIRDPII